MISSDFDRIPKQSLFLLQCQSQLKNRQGTALTTNMPYHCFVKQVSVSFEQHPPSCSQNENTLMMNHGESSVFRSSDSRLNLDIVLLILYIEYISWNALFSFYGSTLRDDFLHRNLKVPHSVILQIRHDKHIFSKIVLEKNINILICVFSLRFYYIFTKYLLIYSPHMYFQFYYFFTCLISHCYIINIYSKHKNLRLQVYQENLLF